MSFVTRLSHVAARSDRALRLGHLPPAIIKGFRGASAYPLLYASSAFAKSAASRIEVAEAQDIGIYNEGSASATAPGIFLRILVTPARREHRVRLSATG